MEAKSNVDQTEPANLKKGGARTPGGLARSKLNALRLGIYARSTLLPGEDAKKLTQLHQDLVAQHQPVGTGEKLLVDQIAAVNWRQLRFSKVEIGLFHMYRTMEGKPGTEAEAFAHDQKNLSIIPKLHAIETSLDRKLYRLIKRLGDLQSNRK